MPAFYSAGPMASQMPLTPPDSGSGQYYSSMHYPAPEQYGANTGMSQPRHAAGYEYQQPYMQPAVVPAPSAYPYSQSSYPSQTSLPSISSYYEPMGAPILPPLRVQDRFSFADDYHRRLQDEQQAAAREQQQRQAQKEEKPTGGVSAKLDYDMDRMTDFVVQATESIFHHSMQSPPSFRKWIHQVLSATRLPSATILLSLHYLNNRVAKYPETVPAGENHIYRLLAVSLILGSKFLDDNTFINRSWSDVTAIKVAELNKLEMEWLDLISYTLHVDPLATGGVKSWLDAWKNYDLKQQQQAARLSPLDTTSHRSSSHRGRFSPYPSPYESTSSRSYETPQSARSSQYSASSYGTNEHWAQSTTSLPSERQARDYYQESRYSSLAPLDDIRRHLSDDRARQSMYAYSQSAQPSYYQPQSYATNSWDHTSWGGAHAYDCGCSNCVYEHHYRPQYSMAPGYHAQSVMG